MDKNEIREKLEELSDRISPDGMSEEERIAVLSELDNLLSVAPNDTDILFWKAMVYEVSEDYLSAVNIYTKILELEPDNKDVINSIKACKELMRISPIIKAEQASTSEPSKPSIMEKISIWYNKNKKIIILSLIIYFCFMQ